MLLIYKQLYSPDCMLLIYRQGRVFARLMVQGFNNSKDPRLGVEFAGR